MQTTTTEYRREYNKENYKIIKAYVTKKEYEEIQEKLKKKNKNIKMSSYIKELILKDLGEELGGGLRIMIEFFVNIAIKLTEIIAWIWGTIIKILSLFR